MLALTEDAQQAIGGILEQADPGAGVRIAPSAGNESAGTLQLSVAPAAAENDKVLDANVDQGQVQFEVLTQAA